MLNLLFVNDHHIRRRVVETTKSVQLGGAMNFYTFISDKNCYLSSYSWFYCDWLVKFRSQILFLPCWLSVTPLHHCSLFLINCIDMLEFTVHMVFFCCLLTALAGINKAVAHLSVLYSASERPSFGSNVLG